MPTSPARSAPSPQPRQLNTPGFTLLELVLVLGLLGILTSLAFGVAGATHRRSASQRAQAELSVLTVALERYRYRFGDYPSTADSGELLAALRGRRGPAGQPLIGAPLLDLAPFTLRDPDPAADGNVLLDPWDAPYRYAYPAAPPAAGFLLYSMGPDGRASAAPDPSASPAAPDDRDNLYLTSE